MARLTLDIRHEGRDEFFAWIASLCEAISNAHLEIELDVPKGTATITHEGNAIVAVSAKLGPDCMTMSVKPTPHMILFADWLLERMPRATVEWRGDWPFITCPPNDDRDPEDDPTPLVPNELVPA